MITLKKYLKNECTEKMHRNNNSRRNNLRIGNIKQQNRKCWENSEEAVENSFMEKSDIDNEIFIERVYRGGKSSKRKGNYEQLFVRFSIMMENKHLK